ncbi:unnamed protein product [Chondrus crispus]|uniref:Uncharacterized protein n=1 Tax=Chondrus crispus TaxID=2769 RepID=R7QG99_CHOCR|nr:unnamed protein product [Chondrus crispus]CDF37104.1 unnamed protein product [Chondrus crispus]|eukprot:XP_005716923.1 unnamed protein product [Chondrus crispus]
MKIWKGKNAHLAGCADAPQEYVISDERWKQIDEELRELGNSVPEVWFGAKPRDSSVSGKWKASECKQFLLHYGLVLLDGHLPMKFLLWFKRLSDLVELCTRPALSDDDVTEIGNLSRSFVRHMERDYCEYSEERVGICKFIVHQLIHLEENIRAFGPPVNYAQWWVERFIGWVKNRLNGRALPAEALTESCKLIESYKIVFKEHFVRSDDHDSSSDSDTEEGISNGGSLHHHTKDLRISGYAIGNRTLKRLLIDYLVRTEDMTAADAESCVQDETAQCFKQIRLNVGTSKQKVGAWDTRSWRKGATSNFYVSAQFESDRGENAREVYYGRIRRILVYKFHLPRGQELRQLVVSDWAPNVKRTSLAQVYAPTAAVFQTPTVEDSSVLLHLIGLWTMPIPREGTAQTFAVVVHSFWTPHRASTPSKTLERNPPMEWIVFSPRVRDDSAGGSAVPDGGGGRLRIR